MIRPRPLTPRDRTEAIIRKVTMHLLEECGDHMPCTSGYAGPDGETLWQAGCGCGWRSPRRSSEYVADLDRLGHLDDPGPSPFHFRP